MHATIPNLKGLKDLLQTHLQKLPTAHFRDYSMPHEPIKNKKTAIRYFVLYGLCPIMECETFCAATKCI